MPVQDDMILISKAEYERLKKAEEYLNQLAGIDTTGGFADAITDSPAQPS